MDNRTPYSKFQVYSRMAREDYAFEHIVQFYYRKT
jgi:hypothetical protein